MEYTAAFRRSVRVHGDRPAVVTDDGREFTYGRLDERSTRLANALHERVPGTRCAVLARNGSAAVESFLAGAKRGVATVQLPYRESPAELAAMVETAGAGALVFDDANVETARSVLDRQDFEAALHAGDRDVDVPGVEAYERALSGAAAELAGGLPAGEEFAVFFTSGTTSTPKAVLFDAEQMWYGATQGVMEHGIEPTDRALVTTPWYHMVTANAWLHPHFLAGATAVLQADFDPVEVLELVAEHEVTGLLAVPTQLEAVCDAQAAGDYDVDSLSYVRTGGSIVTEDLVERVQSSLTEGFYNTYGLTEGGPNLTFAHPSAQDDHPGTIGTESFTWELRVVESVAVDEDPDPTATVDPGERGEVLGRGAGMATGYLDNDEAEQRTFVDGWLRTRDVARVDADGYLYVVDRVDNVIVSGGENVYPAEVERALGDHAAVAEACVVGVDDERWGERVCAVVVTDGSVTEADLDAHCRHHDALANFKRPREYVLSDGSLPRTDTGTLRRAAVLERYF